MQDNRIVLTTWGRSSGFCVDPIEKKPLNHFLPGTPVLSFGTAGCNLACQFCQNWSMSKSREMDSLAHHADPEQLADACIRLGCRSIAYTYNDPVIFLEYAVDVARAAREKGIKSVAVTAGYVQREPRAAFFTEMDAANVDLKAFSERFYRKICGGHLAPVLETLQYIAHETNVWLELTTLLIPGENDSTAELEAMSGWIAENLSRDVPLHLTAFHPDYRMMDKHPTQPAMLVKAREIAMASGLRFVYTGNIRDKQGASTWCPDCDSLLIERDGYELGTWNLDSSYACLSCGASIPGRFEAKAGNWGSRRLPVRFNTEEQQIN